MTRVALVGPPGIAGPIAAALRESPAVNVCGPAVSNGIDTLVYAPRSRARNGMEPNLAEATDVLERAARAGARAAVVVSSGAIYGSSPYHPGLMPETIEPAARGRSPITEGWRAVEALARAHFARESLTILRPSPVLEPDSYFGRILSGRAAVCLPGHDPSIQLLDVEDLAAAVRRAIERAAHGVYHVAPAGVIPLRVALALAGCYRAPIPRTLQRAWRQGASRLGIALPSDHLPFLQYSWTLSGAKIARGLDFTPARSSRQALLRYLGRPDDNRDDVEYDPFGLDTRYIAAHGRAWLAFLERYYWRIEVRGLEHVPLAGRAVLTGVHRGFMPFDGVMTMHLLARRLRRYPRFLIHPSLVKFPFLFNFMTKLGGVLACRRNAAWVLDRDEIVGIYPEGIRGAFTPYKQAYTLGRFGRDEFVRIALRHRAPIVPFITVGSAEIFPIMAKVSWPAWERWTLWPYFPITATFPLLPIPLPSKWHTRFLPALHVEQRYPPEAAEDRPTVAAISREVQSRMQEALDGMLRQRKSVFFGSIFPSAEESEEVARVG
jgi:1-acyl-sn-glycerol-3-phosphate acyltransferase/nucleoside-diphosphate-sugar epimerase